MREREGRRQGPNQIGRPFPKGHSGRPKGTPNKRTIVGAEVSQAFAEKAFDRLVVLLESKSSRISLEACRTILAYAWGAPRQMVEVSGAFGGLAAELAVALQSARASRQAALAAPAVDAVLVAPDAPAVPAIEPAPTPATPEPEVNS